MFSLLSGLLRFLFSKAEINVLIVGLDYAGKTTLLEQMKKIFKSGNPIPSHKIPPTVGLNVGKMDIGGASITFWDVGGQVKLRTLWNRYYADANALIFVVDSSDVARLEEASLAFEAVKEQADLHGTPLMLLCNKQDLPDALSESEIAVQFNASKIKSVPFRLQLISALNGDGVKEGISWLVDKALKKSRALRDS